MAVRFLRPPSPPLTETEATIIGALVEVYFRTSLLAFTTAERAKGQDYPGYHMQPMGMIMGRAAQEASGFASRAFPHLAIEFTPPSE
jgi:hypothetical protein